MERILRVFLYEPRKLVLVSREILLLAGACVAFYRQKVAVVLRER